MEIIDNIKQYLINNKEKINIRALIEVCKAYSIYNIDEIINDFSNNNILNKESKSIYLSKNIQVELIKRFKNGDDKVRDILILTNYPLVKRVVNKTFVYNKDTQDFIQYGILGLIHAVDHYEMEKNVPFPNYAARCIFGYIINYVHNYSTSVSISKRSYMLSRKIAKIEEQLIKEYKKEYITDEEIYNRIIKIDKYNNIPLAIISNLRQLSEISLDKPTRFNDKEQKSLIVNLRAKDNVEKEVLSNIYNEVFQKIFSGEIDARLTNRQLNVLKYKYGFDEEHRYRTSEEVGKILNINPITIRQIERDAFRILRKFFNQYDEKNKEKTI